MTDIDRRSGSELARQIVRQEAGALLKLADSLGEAFDAAVEMILAHPGQLMVTGLGKSGLIGRKIAATLTSTGTPAVSLHPVEGLHGDLGIVTRDNVLLALSKSGHTDELIRCVIHFKQLGGPAIGMTSPTSRLAELCDVVIPLPDEPEAGPLGLAPTTSTTMQLVLGDALAMALLRARGFTQEDFAQYHPEGHLGRRLLLRARDLMHIDAELPLVRVDATFTELLAEMEAKHLGMACLISADGALVGVFTDGDLRRLLIRGDTPQDGSLGDLLHRSRRGPSDPPVLRSTIRPDTPVVECRNVMERSRITCLVVTDDTHRPLGVIRLHDIVQAGVS